MSYADEYATTHARRGRGGMAVTSKNGKVTASKLRIVNRRTEPGLRESNNVVASREGVKVETLEFGAETTNILIINV